MTAARFRLVLRFVVFSSVALSLFGAERDFTPYASVKAILPRICTLRMRPSGSPGAGNRIKASAHASIRATSIRSWICCCSGLLSPDSLGSRWMTSPRLRSQFLQFNYSQCQFLKVIIKIVSHVSYETKAFIPCTSFQWTWQGRVIGLVAKALTRQTPKIQGSRCFNWIMRIFIAIHVCTLLIFILISTATRLGYAWRQLFQTE